MSNRPQTVLLCFALFLFACGFAGFALSGFDPTSHFHGVRFALVIAVCGLIAGRLRRHRVFAVMTIDFCFLLLLALGANYLRLTLKWHGMQGREWYLPYLAAVLGLGSFLTSAILLIVRPRREGDDWWFLTPLLSLPLVIMGFSRRRHGLTWGRRALIGMGLGLLAGGFILTNGARLSNTSVASVVGSARFLSRHQEILTQVLSDPQRIEAIIEDPRARSLIEKVSADVGISDGKVIHSALDNVVQGDLRGAIAVIEEERIDAADIANAVAAAIEEQPETMADDLAEELADSMRSVPQEEQLPAQVMHQQRREVVAHVRNAPAWRAPIPDRELAATLNALPNGGANNDPGLSLQEARELARKTPPRTPDRSDDDRRSELIDDLRLELQVEPVASAQAIPDSVRPVASNGFFEHEPPTAQPPWFQRNPPRGWKRPGPPGVLFLDPAQAGGGASAGGRHAAAVSVGATVRELGSLPRGTTASASSSASGSGAAGASPDAASDAWDRSRSSFAALDRDTLAALVADAADTFSRADDNLSLARAKIVGQYGGLLLMLFGVMLISTALSNRSPAGRAGPAPQGEAQGFS